MPIINVTESLRAGLQNELMDTWKKEGPVYEKQQAVLIRRLSYTNLRKAPYGFKESLPFPERWDYGTTRKKQTFRDRVIYSSIHPYSLAIPWSRWDEVDDQLGDLRSHVQQATRRFLQLPDALYSEYFNGAASLNPALVNAYDGVGIFSNVDGAGNPRFGATGGNIVTGSGLSTAAVMHDMAVAQRRLLSFTDPTARKPLFSEDEVAFSKLVAIIPKELNEIFQKVTDQEFIRSDLTSVTAESNYLKGTFEYRVNQYLTDPSDWYVVLNHNFYKPFIYRGPKGPETVIADMNNSDHARDTAEYAFYADIRVSLGVWFPASIIKIDS